MKIGILGTGNMGRALGTLFAENGHEVFFGSRNGEKARTAAEKAGHGARWGSLDEAAGFGELVLTTIRDIAPSSFLNDTALLDGKIVIDCNNTGIPEDYQYHYEGPTLAEKLQEQLPNTQVVTAFNTIAMPIFELDRETLRQHGVSVYLSGNSESAKETVRDLVENFGFTAVDLGPLRRSIFIQQLADIIRYQLIGQGLGPFYAVSMGPLPAVANRRFT